MSLPPRGPIFDLTDSVAIITGAGSRLSGPTEFGNGRAIAIIFARQGCRVALLDINLSAAQETERIITAEGGTAISIQCDVTSEESCKSAVDQTVELWGSVDILINNVGVGGAHGTVVDVPLLSWDRDLRINLTSMVLMSRFVIPHMRRSTLRGPDGGGSIINMSSVSGIRGGNPGVIYPTSKGAIIQLTRAMAAHHGKENIRVNCIAPGMLYTPMVRVRGMTPQMRSARNAQSLLGTEGTAFDVAYAALYLASHEARWITGIILPVDAGTTAGNPNRPALEEDQLADGHEYSYSELEGGPNSSRTGHRDGMDNDLDASTNT